MKVLGIVGGIAPPSTIDYYRQLTAGYRERSGGDYPRIVISSIDATSFFALLAADDRPAMVERLRTEIARLAGAGADLALFASNTPHVVFDEVARESPIPLISIVEAAASAAQALGYRTLGLLGARFTMERGFYPAVFARRGMTVVVPEAEDRTYVNDRYFGELVEGSFRAETWAGMSAIVARMRDQHGIDAVILGGTELPLLFRDRPPSVVPTLDTTTIHVQSALEQMLR
jgi:aspartate racemase